MITPKGDNTLALEQISPDKVMRVKLDQKYYQKSEEERHKLMSAPGGGGAVGKIRRVSMSPQLFSNDVVS